METIKLYEKAFKTKAVGFCQYKDALPMPDFPALPETAQLVMHSVLPIGSETIYLCDTTPDMPTIFGNGSFPYVELWQCRRC